MANAQHEAQAQQARDQIDQMVKNHDPNLYKTAYAAAKAEFITHQHFEDVTGTKWVDPKVQTDPALMKSYSDGITDNPFRYSEADIAAIPSDQISPDSRRQLQAQRSDAVQASKSVVGGEMIRADRDIHNAFPHSASAKALDISGQREADEKNAIDDLHALYKEGSLRTADDVQKAKKQIINAYAPKSAATKPPRMHVVGPLPPGVAANAASEARKRNFEPSGPAGSD
jgi:hypothetical protein